MLMLISSAAEATESTLVDISSVAAATVEARAAVVSFPSSRVAASVVSSETAAAVRAAFARVERVACL